MGNAARGDELGAFRHGLGELGYVEGRSIVIEERYNDARMEPLPELAAQLVRLEVDVIVVAAGNPGVRAARDATSTIPIVMGQSGVDPVADRARRQPGPAGRERHRSRRHLQGVQPEAPGAAQGGGPRISRVAVLWDAAVPDKAIEVNEIPEAALRLGVQIVSLDARAARGLRPRLRGHVEQQADALLVLNSGLTLTHRARIAELATAIACPRSPNSGILQSLAV